MNTPTTPTTPTGPSTAVVRTLRLGVLGLAALSVLATGYELAATRHWNSIIQLIPWLTLLVLVVAVALATVGGGRLVVATRVLAGLALLASLFGVFQHVSANRAAGSLSSQYSDSWDGRSTAGKWWLAATKSVGAAPPLAPGALGQSALLVLLSTVGAARRAGRDPRGSS